MVKVIPKWCLRHSSWEAHEGDQLLGVCTYFHGRGGDVPEGCDLAEGDRQCESMFPPLLEFGYEARCERMYGHFHSWHQWRNAKGQRTQWEWTQDEREEAKSQMAIRRGMKDWVAK